MAKHKSQSLKPRFPSYREALYAMRTRTHEDVREAIQDAHQSLPAVVRSEVRPGERLEMMFDGIVSAIADQIMLSARDGHEVDMAKLVARHLINHVEVRACRGHA